ncbi:glycosyltransferase family 4 protein [Psychroflexus montanilacus]|uniref:glycosyltransferase family 4 protein n=1 Tax=Psychroflexus montanilacus TaxID=2873598 RepID=UPI001CCC9D03|nr:glycosyltransferase family 4 protein [Psychroflexus montanilacus]MBZ9652111.1 glycosyltransferase family 4 protein [Psychroflexus montanilacus]
MNLAIFSPSQNPYSETFIQAHKNFIKADQLYFVFGSSFQNMYAENQGKLIKPKRLKFIRAISKVFGKSFNASLEGEVLKQLQNFKIDIALVEYGNHANKFLRVFKKANIPFIVHFHGYDASVRNIIEKNNNYKELFKSASYVIAVSKSMREQLKKMGCPNDKLIYNVYGANPIFKERQPLFSKKQAVAIGRFVDKKAPYYTIIAFKELVKKHPDAQLLMAGQGVLSNTCLNLIKYFDLENNVKLLGVVSPEEIAELMQESYCFVQHSITSESGDQEGTPLAVLESALSGLPVVSTYHAGIPDVIEHEKTGLLCEEHDVDKMAKNLIRIFDDVEFAKRLGENAREDHIKNYSLERHIKVLEDLLEKAILKKDIK